MKNQFGLAWSRALSVAVTLLFAQQASGDEPWDRDRARVKSFFAFASTAGSLGEDDCTKLRVALVSEGQGQSGWELLKMQCGIHARDDSLNKDDNRHERPDFLDHILGVAKGQPVFDPGVKTTVNHCIAAVNAKGCKYGSLSTDYYIQTPNVTHQSASVAGDCRGYQCGGDGLLRLRIPAEASGKTGRFLCPSGQLRLESAVYGSNCAKGAPDVADKGGAVCNGKADCNYPISHSTLGDPGPGCAKDFAATYRCVSVAEGETQRPTHSANLPAEASGNSVSLSCPAGTIQLDSAVYGSNCNARAPSVIGRVAASCDGQRTCNYAISHTTLGDPGPGCGKDFKSTYRCVGDYQVGTSLSAELPAEASGKSVALSCRDGLFIKVESAVYGANCTETAPSVREKVGLQCDGKTACSYAVNLADPAAGCAKAFKASYTCVSTRMQQASTPMLSNGMVFKIIEDARIFYKAPDGKTWQLANGEVFEGCGFDWGTVKDVSVAQLTRNHGDGMVNSAAQCVQLRGLGASSVAVPAPMATPKEDLTFASSSCRFVISPASRTSISLSLGGKLYGFRDANLVSACRYNLPHVQLLATHPRHLGQTFERTLKSVEDCRTMCLPTARAVSDDTVFRGDSDPTVYYMFAGKKWRVEAAMGNFVGPVTQVIYPGEVTAIPTGGNIASIAGLNAVKAGKAAGTEDRCLAFLENNSIGPGALIKGGDRSVYYLDRSSKRWDVTNTVEKCGWSGKYVVEMLPWQVKTCFAFGGNVTSAEHCREIAGLPPVAQATPPPPAPVATPLPPSPSASWSDSPSPAPRMVGPDSLVEGDVYREPDGTLYYWDGYISHKFVDPSMASSCGLNRPIKVLSQNGPSARRYIYTLVECTRTRDRRYHPLPAVLPPVRPTKPNEPVAKDEAFSVEIPNLPPFHYVDQAGKSWRFFDEKALTGCGFTTAALKKTDRSIFERFPLENTINDAAHCLWVRMGRHLHPR